MLTTIDYISYQHLTSIFIASIGVSVLLSADLWVYFALQSWIYALFAICYAIFLRYIANPGTLRMLLSLMVFSLLLGLYLQFTRIRM